MKNNDRFKKYRKLSSLRVGLWCFIIFGFFSLLLGLLINSLSKFNEFKNYEINGIVEKYYVGEDTLKINLKNDNNVYYINNIVYNDINKDVYNFLKENVYIKLYIAYQDEYERYNISQLEIDGKVFLDRDKSESAEYSNYIGSQIVSYVFICIGAILEVLGLVYYLKIRTIKKEEKII